MTQQKSGPGSMMHTDSSSTRAAHPTEEDYHFLFENNPNPMWIFDAATLQFLAVNSAAISRYGYAREEFLHMTLRDIRPEEDIPALQEAIRLLDRDPEPDRAWRHRCKDGSLFYAEIRSRSVTYAGRSARLGVIHDVTKRVMAERALSYSESQLRTLMEATPAAIFIFLRGRFQYANRAAELLTGYGQRDLPSLRIADLVDPGHLPLMEERMSAHLRGEDLPARYELRIRTQSGDCRWIDVSLAAMQFDGEPALLGTAVDITAQKTTRDMLLQSEEKFRTLTETTTAGIFFYCDDRFNYVNRSMEAITGFTRDELQHMRFREIVHPDHHEFVRQRAIARQQGRDIPSRYELKILTKQKSVRWIEVAPSMVDWSGKHVLVGTAVDVTDRKRAEEELRRSEELTHRILEAVPGGILEVDLHGDVLQANMEAQHFLGIQSLDLLKMNARDIAATCVDENGVAFPVSQFPLMTCLDSGDDQSPVTLGVRRPDGTLSWAVCTAVPLINVITGRMNGAVLTFLDITGRKHTEDKLRESEERYRKFFEEDLTGDFIAAPDGRILSCNPAFAAIFGFPSVASALQENVRSIFHEPDAFERLCEVLQQEKKIEYHEAVAKHRDGHTVYVIENLIGLFDENGRFAGLKGYVFDNTAQKILEQHVQQAQKIESLGRLAGGVAHDFNNLLGIILGYAERLLKNDDAASRKDVEAIYTAAQRGTALVRQLLTFARKTPVRFEQVQINAVIEELKRLLAETFPRNIALTVNPHPSLPRINGDVNQIHQALLNLCVNARDAMPDGGMLTLRTDVVAGDVLRQRAGEAQADFYACVSVSDSGTGMDEEVRSKIFEPFFSTKDIGKGTGLGLAVVYGIVKAHRGIVEVASEHGKGAAFFLYFPIEESPQSTPMSEEQRTMEAPGGNETILLVEDEELLLELVQALLTSKGYNVLTATDGETAVKLFAEHRDKIDLVLTDLGLPRLGGWDVCRRIREFNPHVRIVVATGYLDPGARGRMIDEGIKEFVHKPYLAAELTQKVRELLDATT